MTGPVRRGFAARPRDPESWVRAPEVADVPGPVSRAEQYSARLTLDVTPAMRARIKVAAFSQGLTVADMLRALLEERYPAAEAPQ